MTKQKKQKKTAPKKDINVGKSRGKSEKIESYPQKEPFSGYPIETEVGLFSKEDFQTGTSSSLPREPSTVSMDDVEPTEFAPSSKGDVPTSDFVPFSSDLSFPRSFGTINVGKSKEIGSFLRGAFHDIDKSEDVEFAKVSPTSKDKEASSTTPSVEEIKKWKRADVIKFLQEKQEELDLDNEDIEIIKTNKVAGQAFLHSTKDELMQIGLAYGPAKSITHLIETLIGGDVTRKRKYEESPEVLTEIVERAVRKEFSRQIPDEISLSNLSQSRMRKIIDDVGLRNVVFSDEDFQPIESVSYKPFRWNMDLAEDQQMDGVETWFKNALNLPRGFHVKDVHTQKNYQRHLRGANVTLAGGTDISIGPSHTSCVWIETKKTAEDFKEAQAIGELFLIDKLHPTNAMTVLTDCNDHWVIYFFLTDDKKQYIVTCNIRDRGVALTIIKQFVLEEGRFLFGLAGKAVTYNTVNLPGPLKKKAKFDERIFEADNEDRMADMVGDMSEQELFNMSIRKRLMLVRDFCRLDEQPQVDQLIGQFSDNYENPPSMMFT